MKQYRPDVERQKRLYSMMKSRAVIRRRQGRPEGNAHVARGKRQIPDNSEPWLPDHSLALLRRDQRVPEHRCLSDADLKALVTHFVAVKR